MKTISALSSSCVMVISLWLSLAIFADTLACLILNLSKHFRPGMPAAISAYLLLRALKRVCRIPALFLRVSQVSQLLHHFYIDSEHLAGLLSTEYLLTDPVPLGAQGLGVNVKGAVAAEPSGSRSLMIRTPGASIIKQLQSIFTCVYACALHFRYTTFLKNLNRCRPNKLHGGFTGCKPSILFGWYRKMWQEVRGLS